ncbi:class I SAM-dependent methyltransferase [Acinetobacter sp. C26M]|uniref:class I SAM-dependent methyltransferase n=1 Tax=unclassified Acinetobacter TaxID=196816 RepID=UPI002036D35D|nr:MULTISPECIES: class I SAM-dependent methyltransferase [unclassified Acinetobacter]USA46789.1 class I SAM-dependent methyltransferase [Acinetobacter sp. C26M]USA50273.1 class I SAM-dependent methyltransferase [Acinetobacter sp. C26G]
MKDLFSEQSELYQQARPTYPQTLVNCLIKQLNGFERAWDCGAGSGQLTQLIAPYFRTVIATDLSQNQLDQAPALLNVQYLQQAAEQTSFADRSFDLITVAQAIHWFDFEKFYAEVKRTLRVDGLFAVIGYGLIRLDDTDLNQRIDQLYHHTLKGFWDVERRYIDEQYQTIPFPFEEITMPQLQIVLRWTGAQLWDYLNTWSAVKHYQNQLHVSPLESLQDILQMQQPIGISFPILLRVGRLAASK